MKPIIFKHHTKTGGVYRRAIYLFGICVYAWEYPENTDAERHRAIGFTSFPNDAPGYIEDDDYYSEDD